MSFLYSGVLKLPYEADIKSIIRKHDVKRYKKTSVIIYPPPCLSKTDWVFFANTKSLGSNVVLHPTDFRSVESSSWKYICTTETRKPFRFGM